LDAPLETPNLAPYTLEKAVDPRSFPLSPAEHAAALDRARFKLARTRENPAAEPDHGPVQLGVSPQVATALSGLLGMTVLSTLAAFTIGQIFIVYSVGFGSVTASFCAIAIGELLKDRTRDAKDALKVFLFAAGRSQIERLTKLVLGADFDESPRALPMPFFRDSGSTIARVTVGTAADLAKYWRVVIAAEGFAPSAQVSVQREKQLAPDLVLVSLLVKYTQRRPAHALAWAAVCLGGFFLGLVALVLVFSPKAMPDAVNIDHTVIRAVAGAVLLAGVGAAIYAFPRLLQETLGGNAETREIQKLMIKVHGRWRLFSGELMAPEDADLSWLDMPKPSIAPAD
jgi:hypothetical protein